MVIAAGSIRGFRDCALFESAVHLRRKITLTPYFEVFYNYVRVDHDKVRLAVFASRKAVPVFCHSAAPNP